MIESNLQLTILAASWLIKAATVAAEHNQNGHNCQRVVNKGNWHMQRAIVMQQSSEIAVEREREGGERETDKSVRQFINILSSTRPTGNVANKCLDSCHLAAE